VTSRALALLLVLAWMFFAGHRLGLPVTAMIAGLGVGGLAVALAAQSSIENLIGGISLYADQPVRIGEWLQLGDRRGCLEEVGLRSAKIRTPEGTLYTLPNAAFAKLAVVNLSRREKTLLKTSLRLRYDTTGDQLQYVLAKLQAMLEEHPEFDPEEADAKLAGFGPYFLEVQFQAFANTTNWPRFKEIRQDVFMRALAIVEEAGTALALPSEIHYAAEDRGSDPARVREVEAQVARWRERGELPSPELPERTD
jgi:MscS family membrane protein